MKVYESDEEVTIYFVVFKKGAVRNVQAWSDNKELAKAYVEFHNCKDMKVRSLTKEMKDMIKLINENNHDEIEIQNLIMRDPKHRYSVKEVAVPMTASEGLVLRSDENSFMSSWIDYSLMNQAIPFMKNKWQRVLKAIHVEDVIASAVHSKQSKFTNSIKLDQLSVLLRSLPEHFGI